MEYNRNDKNGNDVIVTIYNRKVLNFEYVNCDVITRERKGWFIFKFKITTQLYSVSHGLDYIRTWNCNALELWADRTLSHYNDKLTRIEEETKVKGLINNGC